MAVNNLSIEKTNRPAENNFFENFYNSQVPISGAQYDAVFTFFLSRTNNNKDAARSLASSLLEITYEVGINPLVVIDDFKKYNQNESFKTALIALFNSSRRNTSKIGFSANPTPTPLVLRNIRTNAVVMPVTGGAAQTFIITTVGNPGTPPPNNIYQVNGVNNPVLTLVRGEVYTFDQSHVSNDNHPIAFKDSSGNSFITGVVSTGTPGLNGARTVFTVPTDAPNNLRYYCTVHGNGMGNIINVVDSEMLSRN